MKFSSLLAASTLLMSAMAFPHANTNLHLRADNTTTPSTPTSSESPSSTSASATASPTPSTPKKGEEGWQDSSPGYSSGLEAFGVYNILGGVFGLLKGKGGDGK